jgi:hypothetical protein
MKTIYKYQLSPDVDQTINLPYGAQILSAGELPGVDGGELFIWAKVDTNNQLHSRRIVIFGTGWKNDEVVASKVGDRDVFINTVICRSGLVFHVFERQNWDTAKENDRV